MKKQSAKPNVAPPASYKMPSLPTLAALGALTAAALATGCRNNREHLDGIIEAPNEPWVEKGSETVPPFPGIPARPLPPGVSTAPVEIEKAASPKAPPPCKIVTLGEIPDPNY